MVLDDRGFDGWGRAGPLCQAVVRECEARRFSGAVLDLEGRTPPLEQIVRQLDGLFARRGWQLYVPEVYGRSTEQAQVMIPSALSGGSLEARLEEASARFGHGRIALALQRVAEDFRLPSPTGSGTPLTREVLAEQMARLRPTVFFSRELCARYYTYVSRDGGVHFVLFDDGQTLARKMEVGRAAGVTAFLIPWAEAEGCAHQFLERMPQR
jgi:hypothetical protein